MPFVLNPNCLVDIWVEVSDGPWVTGDPPTYTEVPAQKIKSWLAIDGNQVAGLESGGIGIHRFVWDETPRASAGWTESSGNHSYFCIRQAEGDLYYCIMAVDHWFDGGAMFAQLAWATMQWSPAP